jgi:hypothetical protein
VDVAVAVAGAVLFDRASADATDDVDVKVVNYARSQWERREVGASALREELGRGR